MNRFANDDQDDTISMGPPIPPVPPPGGGWRWRPPRAAIFAGVAVIALAGGQETLDVQRGTVTAVSGTSLAVKSTDGYTATYAVTSDTLVDAKAQGSGSVKNGDTVLVITTAGSKPTAANVADITAIKAGRASLGFPMNPAKPKILTPTTPPAGT